MRAPLPLTSPAAETLDPESVAEHAGGITRRGFVAGGLATAAALLSRRALAFTPDPGTTPVYRIHPGIGVARLGNTDPSAFFIGPEVPGQGPSGDAPGTVAPPYKDGGLVKPQAARFRLFEYVTVNGLLTPVGEVNLDTPGVLNISWSVYLANRKASFHQFAGPAGESAPPAPLRNAAVADRASLEIDLGPRAISGRSQGPAEFRVGTSGNPALETYPRKADGTPVIDYLGQLRTDAAGRLLVLGGQGRTGSTAATPPPLSSYANNDDWFDDISDGPVTATVTIQDGGGTRTIQVGGNGGGAWVLVAPPDFAPRIGNAVTMYDLLFDMGVRSLPVPQNALYYNGGPLQRLRALHDDFQPSADVEFPSTIADFATEIQPVLLHGYQYRYVTELVNQKHDSLISPALASPDPQNAKSWQGVFVYLRTPLGATSPTGKGTMPRTRGDDPYTGSEPDAVRNLTLTRTQYGLMRRWSGGFFDPPPATPPPPDTTITPAGLDRAALENCVGGAFFPGIEASWQIRNPGLFWEPFRLNLNATSQYIGEAGQPIRAGHFSRQMAVPWQADFNDCRTEGDYGWWPGQRPTAVFLNPTDSLNQRVDWARPDTTFAGNNHQSNHSDMVALWYKFGFVVQVQPSGAFIETERAPQVP